MKPRLHKQNPDGARVEEKTIVIKTNKTGRLKPRLHKQNPDGARVEEKTIVEITLFSLHRGGGHRLCRRGFNRRLI